jgi:hypothetical protein
MYKAQYAFNMSMIMCPAVHMGTRSLLRSSSTHEPSDPLSRVKIYTILYITLHFRYQHTVIGEEFSNSSPNRGGIVSYLGVNL